MLSFVFYEVQHANGAMTPQGKSFHCLAPFEVTSAFSDQGPEYSLNILRKTSIVNVVLIHSAVKMTQRSSKRSLGGGVQYILLPS